MHTYLIYIYDLWQILYLHLSSYIWFWLLSGVLFYEVYRFNIQTVNHSAIIGVVNNNISYHEAALNALHLLDFSFLPPGTNGLEQILRDMLQIEVQNRTSVNDLLNHSYLVSGPLLILRTVDSLHTKDVGTQASQLISLPNHLGGFPPRVLEGTVLPTICRICEVS